MRDDGAVRVWLVHRVVMEKQWASFCSLFSCMHVLHIVAWSGDQVVPRASTSTTHAYSDVNLPT